MYTEKYGHLIPGAAPGLVSVSGTGVGTPTLICMSQCVPSRICFTMATAATGGTAAVVSFYVRPTYASDTNRVLIGTLKIPDATAIGQCVYKDVTDVGLVFLPGQQIIVSCTTANTVGSGYWGLEYTDSPANAKALTTMVASA